MTNYHIGQCCTAIHQVDGRYANIFLFHNAIVLLVITLLALAKIMKRFETAKCFVVYFHDET